MQNNNKVPFSELLLWNNKTILEISMLCGKSERTIKQYIKENKPCKTCQTLLIWLYYGIPQIDDWQGWKYRKGSLISPHDEAFTVKHLEMLPILNQWRNEQEAEIKKEKRIAGQKIRNMAHF